MRSASIMVDITPPIGMSICGNIREDNLSRGIHDPLYCNAVLCEHEGTTLLMVVLDWAGILKEEADIIREKLSAVLGIPIGNIIVSATHTHSGPNVIDFAGDEREAGKIQEYFRDVEAKLEKEIAKLPEGMEVVTLWGAQCEVEGLSFCRRLRMADGKVVMNWNEVDPTDVVCATGIPDKEMTVVGFKRMDGSWQTILMNFALHPAICVGRDWLWSADWVHYLREAVWEKYENKPVVYFVNGTQGDVNHLNYEKFNLDAFPEAERYGYSLAEYLVKAVEDSTKMEDDLKISNGAVALYKRVIPEEWITWAKKKWAACGGQIPSLLHGIPSEYYAREIIKAEAQDWKKRVFPMMSIKLGDAAFVTVPGEIFSSIGKQIKKDSPYKMTGIMGLTLGSCGYIPDKKAFLEGGYEPRIGVGSKYQEDACDKISNVAVNLLETLEK